MSRIPVIRERGWWSPFLAGAAAGLLASVLLRRGGPATATAAEEGAHGAGDPAREGVRPGGGWDRWRDAWDDAVEGASEGLASARELFTGRSSVDEAALRARVEALPCATDCRVRLLGAGIVEVVGSCATEGDARTLLDALAAEPGVEVVVNRVWTPESTGD